MLTRYGTSQLANGHAVVKSASEGCRCHAMTDAHCIAAILQYSGGDVAMSCKVSTFEDEQPSWRTCQLVASGRDTLQLTLCLGCDVVKAAMS